MIAGLYAKLYWTLVASFCVMGLCLAFAQPLFSVPDEPAHWYTAHVRTERLFGSDECVKALGMPHCPEGGPCGTIPPLEFACQEAWPIYGGVTTYPGVLLSKLILPRQTESPLRHIQAMVLARLLQGLMVVLCLLRAGVVVLRAQRQGLLVLGAFVLSPLVAQQSFSITSDGGQIAFGVCLFAAIVAWRELGWIDLALFVIFGFAAAAKPTLLPIILPAVVAGHWLAEVDVVGQASPLDALRSLGRALRPSRAPSVQTLMLWAALALSLLTVFFSLHHDANAEMGPVHTHSRQVNGDMLRRDPFLVLELVSKLRHGARLWVGPLGWLNVKVAPTIANTFVRILGVMAAIELGRWLVRLRRAPVAPAVLLRYLARALPGVLVGLTGVVANLLFMVAVMYLLWTSPGAPRVDGIQHRYFIPAAMVLIAVVFRTLSGLHAPEASVEARAPETPRSRRIAWAAAFAAPALVLSLSLPYVARVFVDLSLHYHDPVHFK
jgi:hypothetical protein